MEQKQEEDWVQMARPNQGFWVSLSIVEPCDQTIASFFETAFFCPLAPGAAARARLSLEAQTAFQDTQAWLAKVEKRSPPVFAPLPQVEPSAPDWAEALIPPELRAAPKDMLGAPAVIYHPPQPGSLAQWGSLMIAFDGESLCRASEALLGPDPKRPNLLTDERGVPLGESSDEQVHAYWGPLIKRAALAAAKAMGVADPKTDLFWLDQVGWRGHWAESWPPRCLDSAPGAGESPDGMARAWRESWLLSQDLPEARAQKPQRKPL